MRFSDSPRRVEHIDHRRDTHADQHLHKVRAGDGEERDLGLAGNGPRRQGLASTRLSDHQYPFRYLAAVRLEFGRVAEEIERIGKDGNTVTRYLQKSQMAKGHRNSRSRSFQKVPRRGGG